MITELGERLGKVIVVAFDPDKPQVQDYVRIQIRFDVSRPLRKTMVVNLPEGGSTIVKFNYERVQKRCYECQRLNHAQEVFPKIVKKRKDAASERRQRILYEKSLEEKIIGPQDPLFGVLSEAQVGICPQTGRKKISTEVLDEMRRYMLMATEKDKLLRIERIKSSVAEAEKDPLLQKTVLRLEPSPVFTTFADKGKGRVFDLDLNKDVDPIFDSKTGEGKLMASAIRANKIDLPRLMKDTFSTRQKLELDHRNVGVTNSGPRSSSARNVFKDSGSYASFEGNSTEYGLEFSAARSSGVVQKTSRTRRRPHIRKRQGMKDGGSRIL
ncbi:uncharacterized protein LOC125576909 [Brassica napus]|uniref:uncharacterized protein LOC125576909 n=1 Tax=Brassica napus TaxID=3708 RepID=UPI0020788EFD|nr:uncharacterized protein LOC125576909 [Brassica napus]